jgi:hypothetical protein
VPFFCHNNGINFLAKLFLSDEVKAEAVDVDLVRSSGGFSFDASLRRSVRNVFQPVV